MGGTSILLGRTSFLPLIAIPAINRPLQPNRMDVPPRSPLTGSHFLALFLRVDVPGTSIHSKDMDSPLDEATMYGKAIEHLESCLGQDQELTR